MKTSEVFKQAKTHLWDGCLDYIDGEFYICHAIEEAAWVRATKRPAPYNRAKKIIQKRIHPEYDLDNWVRKNVKGSWRTLNKIRGPEQMQAYRHRWLDALIIEFETKGD